MTWPASQEAVAVRLHDTPVEAADRLGGELLVRVQHLVKILGIKLVRERARVDEAARQDG